MTTTRNRARRKTGKREAVDAERLMVRAMATKRKGRAADAAGDVLPTITRNRKVRTAKGGEEVVVGETAMTSESKREIIIKKIEVIL